MQPLENTKNLLMILRGNPHAIVRHRKERFTASFLCSNMNARGVFSSILYRVSDEVLEQLNKMRFPALDSGQTIARHNGPTLFDRRLEILRRLLKDEIQIDPFSDPFPSPP